MKSLLFIVLFICSNNLIAQPNPELFERIVVAEILPDSVKRLEYFAQTDSFDSIYVKIQNSVIIGDSINQLRLKDWKYANLEQRLKFNEILSIQDSLPEEVVVIECYLPRHLMKLESTTGNTSIEICFECEKAIGIGEKPDLLIDFTPRQFHQLEKLVIELLNE